jgi:hypothetical protein
MTIAELKKTGKCPEWLALAITDGADVTVTEMGWVIWKYGNFRGGNFRGGDFWGGDFWGGDFWGGDFRGGDFWGGNFWGGDFWGGDFRGGDFRGGNFRGGNFRGGDFWGGDFWGGNAHGVKADRILTMCHVDGWPKTLCAINGVAYILAGCQWFTLADARKHWSKRPDRTNTLAMLTGIEIVAKQWKLKFAEPKRKKASAA